MFYISMRNADGTQYYSGLGWSHDYDEATIFDTEAEAETEIEIMKTECAAQWQQGDYGLWQVKVRDYTPRLNIITSSCTENRDDDGYGGHYERYTVAEVPSKLSNETLAELVKEEFPGTHCQHEYDCCGNYYASSATFIRGTTGRDEKRSTVLIRQEFSQNV